MQVALPDTARGPRRSIVRAMCVCMRHHACVQLETVVGLAELGQASVLGGPDRAEVFLAHARL